MDAAEAAFLRAGGLLAKRLGAGCSDATIGAVRA